MGIFSKMEIFKKNCGKKFAQSTNFFCQIDHSKSAVLRYVRREEWKTRAPSKLVSEWVMAEHRFLIVSHEWVSEGKLLSELTHR